MNILYEKNFKVAQNVRNALYYLSFQQFRGGHMPRTALWLRGDFGALYGPHRPFHSPQPAYIYGPASTD